MDVHHGVWQGFDVARGSKDAPTNPRGIPYAPFVDKVEDYVTSRAEVEGTLKSFSEMISKYQFMEVNTQRRAAGLKDKIPDIEKTLDTVRFLKTRKSDAEPIETMFELNDTLYAKANVAATEEVYLWLGANVMLAYPIPEAESLLESKLSAAKTSLVHCEEDLDFLREQITTLEVATARVYNWDVSQRRKEREDDAKSSKANGPDEPNG
ncbi:peptide chain release factor 1 [Zalaria obscura]|uniref:Peptide chain release factor 1 n=1 Tax=Zalaria obscura TaxID=2024903 RepID=A0ACC3SP59_9PEZI